MTSAAAQTAITITNPSKRDTGIVQVSLDGTSGAITAAASLQGRFSSSHAWANIVSWTTAELALTGAAASANKMSLVAAVSLMPLMRLNVTSISGTGAVLNADLMD